METGLMSAGPLCAGRPSLSSVNSNLSSGGKLYCREPIRFRGPAPHFPQRPRSIFYAVISTTYWQSKRTWRPRRLLGRSRAGGIAAHPFLALVILEGGDHRPIAALGDAFREAVVAGDGLDLGDDRLDPRRRAHRRGIGFETPGLRDIFAALGHQGDDLAVQPVDIVAHLAKIGAALAAVDRGRTPISGMRPRRVALRKRRMKAGEQQNGERGGSEKHQGPRFQGRTGRCGFAGMERAMN